MWSFCCCVALFFNIVQCNSDCKSLSVCYLNCSLLWALHKKEVQLSFIYLNAAASALGSASRRWCLHSIWLKFLHSSYKAYGHCSLFLKSFDIPTLVLAYKNFVCPILESCTQVWAPWLLRDIQCIERIQRFFTSCIYKRANMPYTDKANCLLILHLPSLEYHRIYFEMVKCFKTIKTTVSTSPLKNSFSLQIWVTTHEETSSTWTL